MAPSKLLVALNTLLWYQCLRHMALPRSIDSEETIVESTINQEGIMEIALIPGLFVAIFVGIAACILWWPYDK
jgi:hypothetical protein